MKDRVYSVPDESAGFVFTLEKPCGAEFIKVIASTEQFKTIETPLDNLGRGAQALITRGLP